MPTTIWEIIAGTPWWVFGLFIYLSYAGFLATKPQIVPLKTLFIIPVIFVFMSIISMFTVLHITLNNLGLWCAAGLTGCALGWLQFRAMKVKAIRNEAKLYMPGSWLLLVIVLILFACRYYINYEVALDPAFLSQSKYTSYIYIIFGLFTGLFAGRLLFARRVLKAGPYFNKT